MRSAIRPVAVVVAMQITVWAGVASADPPLQLTTDGRIKRDPVFVDGGRAIVFTLQSDSPRLVLAKLDLASRRMSRVFPDANLPELKCVFSTDQRTRAWLRITGNDRVSLLVHPAGAETAYVVKTAKTVSWSPALTPDGRHVVFNLAGQLMVHSIPPKVIRPLAKSSGRNDWPAISPDGRRIAFGSSRDGNFEIYVADLDGQNIRRLTQRPGLDMRPAWSPDGKRIAFTSVRDGNYEVYVMSADGQQSVNVSRHTERDDYASWHPDGRKLVWVREVEGRYDLFQSTVVDEIKD